ncbi:MAG: class I SAM-dependent methyltransferase [Candidatus Bathyarchaeota archaeon]|nr:class I SAM-dependent methyltransferase [Candidatus Bathyarchaeota archaeon]
MDAKVKTVHDECARSYDDACRQTESYAHEIVFGLTYEFVQAQQTLLDVGVGTGLGSVLFHKAGLVVYGVDHSEEMLGVCREKAFAKELKTCDLRIGNWPYTDNQFHHAICCGVFHFIRDLDVFFAETRRVLQNSGTFSFTTIDKTDKACYLDESGICIYCHSQDDIRELAKKYGFTLLKTVAFYAFKTPAKKEQLLFRAYTLQKL